MKKGFLGFLSITLALAVGLFVACPNEEPTPGPGETDVTVTFNTDGGTPAISPVTLKKGESLGAKYPNDPEKNDYIFVGWFAGNVEYGPTTKINASVTLKAKWAGEDEVYTVTFDAKGGNPVSSVKVLEMGTLGARYPTPTHDDIAYVFAGWFYMLGLQGEEEVTATTAIWETMTVAAKWTISDATVTFDTNGGSPATIASITVKYGDPIGVAKFPAEPTKSGNLFRGWYKTADTTFTTPYAADTPILGDTALKARWVDSSVTTFTVTFNKNNTDATGSTAANPATRAIPQGEEISTLPTPPTRTEGWGAGMYFVGWNTLADGSGTPVTAATKVTAAMEVFAQWEFVPGEAEVVGQTLVHYAPAMEVSGEANNNQGVWQPDVNTENDDGSVTYAGGAVRYRFPDFSNDYDLDDFDFFTVSYVAKNSEGTNEIKGSMLKQFSSANGLPTREGVGAPTLSTSGSLEFDIRDIASTEPVKGIAIQNISDVTPPSQLNTIKWTKVVFTKGTRVQITFVTGTEQTLPPITGVVGTPIGTLPLPTAPAGKFLLAWKDGLGNTVTRTTVVTGAMTLTAEYKDMAQAQRWTVNFSSLDMLTLIGPDMGRVELFTGATYTGAPATSNLTGYSFFPGTVGWENSQVKFKVTLPEDTPLSAYTSVTARVNAVQGDDATYKQAGLVAGQPLPVTFGGATPLASAWDVSVYVNNRWVNNNAQTLTYTIKKDTAAALMGEIEMCVYFHFPADTSATPRRFQVYDVTFNP
jgi:uncharacterized repeat protein (TIGR02543 family)